MSQTGNAVTPTVWVDGDSCPVPVRDILVRWHRRGRLNLHFFTNRPLPLDPTAGQTVGRTVVTDGTVDQYILDQLRNRSEIQNGVQEIIIVTRDIPLAERCLEYACTVMNDRGTVFTRDTVGERRSLRDASAEIRALGLETMDKRRVFGKKEQKLFSDALDRVLSSLKKNRTLD